jgi:tripartite-type tricarboxylate transporter receptor subunit TctC
LKISARTAAFAALVACGAAAQSPDQYPSRPIRYVVASAPGGIADITARVLGPRLSEALHQPVVIENRTAGGILVGIELVAKAPPDGYTLLSATPQVAIAQSMYKRATVDPRKALAPIALVGMIPNVLVVGPRTPAKSVAELVALARKDPGRLNYSSTGAGTSVHLAAELFKYQAGVNIVHVPYRGAAAAMTALIAGDVDMLVDSLPPSLPHIRAGKVRALAVTSAARAPQLPDVPTMAEAGFPGFEVSAWSGVVTAAETPPAIIARLEAEIRRALDNPQTAATYEKAGLPVHYLGANDFGAFWDREIAKFAVAVKHSGAAVE